MSPESMPLTITAAATALRAGEITSLDLTSTMLERIERLNGPLGAFVTVMTRPPSRPPRRPTRRSARASTPDHCRGFRWR